MKDVAGDQLSQTSYGMPLDGEKEEKGEVSSRINCILVHAKVAIVSKKRVANENNSATICSRAQNRVQVDAPSKRACPKT